MVPKKCPVSYRSDLALFYAIGAVHLFAAQPSHPQGVALRGATWAGPQTNEPYPYAINS